MSLYQDYRPKSLKTFYGNEDLKRDLKPFIKGTRTPPKAILFTGPSGCGKTTLARILAKSFGCSDPDIQELDTADFRGIDSIREIRRQMGLASLTGTNRVWILDECFAPGTMIATPQGSRPIEAIKAGDSAYSAAGQDTVLRVFKNRVPLERVCRLICHSDHSLFSSIGHLFFTLRGWVEVQNLRRGEIIFVGDFGNESKKVPQNLRDMWRTIYGRIGEGNLLQQEMQAQKIKFESEADIRQYLHVLRKAFFDGGGSAQILLSRLLSQFTKREEPDGGDPQDFIRQAQGIFSNGTRNISASDYKSAYENGQSEKKCGDHEKGISDKERTGNSGLSQTLQRGQRQIIPNAEIVNKQTGRFCCAGVCNFFGQTEAGRLSDKLQGGSGNSASSACNRNRWAGTQFTVGKDKRFQKTGQIGIARVESVEIYQRSYFGRPGWNCIGDKEISQGFVEFYDLELKNHHSYFADGILVHNCHKLTNDAQNALLKALENPPSYVFFILCTTDPQLLIKTILTRCTQFVVEALTTGDLIAVLKRVCDGEKADVPEDVLKNIAKKAQGSPRAAISALERVLARTPEEYAEEFESFMSYETQIKDLCQILLKGNAKWSTVADFIKGIKEEPETVRRSVLGYMNSVLLSGKDAPRAAYIIDCFKEPYYNTGPAGLTLSCYAGLLKE